MNVLEANPFDITHSTLSQLVHNSSLCCLSARARADSWQLPTLSSIDHRREGEMFASRQRKRKQTTYPMQSAGSVQYEILGNQTTNK